MASVDTNAIARLLRDPHKCNFGKLSRMQCEQLLTDESVGTFLIRDSDYYPRGLTLSVRDRTKVQHHQIKFDSARQMFTIDHEAFFPNLQHLVLYHKLDASGLCCRLERLLSPEKGAGEATERRTSASFIVAPASESPRMIDYQELHVGKVIGSGEFSDVYEGTFGRARVAIKVLKERNSTGCFLHEAEVMSSLRHRNLVQFLGIARDPNNGLCLVTEFMSKGSLLHYLTTRGRSVILPKDLAAFAVDVCEALSYLEENHVVHRDIAASNVLIADDNTAKVTDFGLAKVMTTIDKQNEGSVSTEKIKCRTKWTAPEALEFKKYSHKSDVWSYGILLWEMFSYGRCPYPRIPASDVLTYLKEGYRMEPPGDCPAEIGDIMRQSWQIDSDRRPSFGQLLERLKHAKASLQ